jgi:hypothetical protein
MKALDVLACSPDRYQALNVMHAEGLDGSGGVDASSGVQQPR